jgi:predicted MPP superfamily phosphohydrolase
MGVVAGGFINAISPKVKALSLRIEKDATGFKNLTIAVASDLHIGIMTRNGHLGKIVNLVKSCDPDLIFLVGDIVDEDMPPLKENQVLRMLQGLRAPLGVFAVTGNHEYYSGLAKNLALLQKAGVTVLRDEAVKVGESFFVIGRKDPTGTHVGVGRKPLAEITAALDRRRPLLLLDHQPVRLAEAEENGIDLQLSGHTHAGQLFPLDLINKKVWELNWGYLRKGQTQYYVSCGVGTWGPPLRTGSVPEIVKIELEFRKP